MKLRGTEFGTAFCAPGAQGFYGEGYPFHPLWKYAGMTWSGTTFVAKTTTLARRPGNLPLGKNGITPKELFPKCVVVKPWSGHVLNAVGLSGPGARALFIKGPWQARTEPFMLSFMAVGATKEERLQELRDYVEMLAWYWRAGFEAKIALQINFGCPNVGLHIDNLCDEVCASLDIAAELDIPIVLNFNPLVPIEVLRAAGTHPACDAFWIGNTVPWGTKGIDWLGIFGSTESPLRKRGINADGGLSGPACLPLVMTKLVEARSAGIRKPIVVGNGFQDICAVDNAFASGASGVAFGVVGIVRPWRMRSLIHIATRSQ